MHSVWSQTVNMPSFEALKGDKQTDVLIIGGGIAGLLCAYFLCREGINCVLVEADRICSGITKNTTAKITSQHGFAYHKLLKRFGQEKAGAYLRANENAVKQYRAMCSEIDCDFELRDSFVYSLDDPTLAAKEIDALRVLGGKGEFTENLPLPFPVAGAVKLSRQGQFHPLKFLGAIAAGLPVYENTPVRALSPGVAAIDGGRIKAEKIIVATHFPMLNKHGSYFLKLYQDRSYVLALEDAPQYPGMYVDGSGKGLSFRNYDRFLLLGGGSHRTGKAGGGWKKLEQFCANHYPDAGIKYRWATQDCMTLDGVPYIGQYSKNTPDLFVATGFNKWGMTSSMVAALRLTKLIKGEEDFAGEVFSPSRSVLHPQLGVNAFESLSGLLNFKTKRCPHMGCALKWNPQERTWDCPCHGSRFHEDGRLIDNPATGDLKKGK